MKQTLLVPDFKAGRKDVGVYSDATFYPQGFIVCDGKNPNKFFKIYISNHDGFNEYGIVANSCNVNFLSIDYSTRDVSFSAKQDDPLYEIYMKLGEALRDDIIKNNGIEHNKYRIKSINVVKHGNNHMYVKPRRGSLDGKNRLDIVFSQNIEQVKASDAIHILAGDPYTCLRSAKTKNPKETWTALDTLFKDLQCLSIPASENLIDRLRTISPQQNSTNSNTI